jgi:hypothetical protein
VHVTKVGNSERREPRIPGRDISCLNAIQALLGRQCSSDDLGRKYIWSTPHLASRPRHKPGVLRYTSPRKPHIISPRESNYFSLFKVMGKMFRLVGMQY